MHSTIFGSRGKLQGDLRRQAEKCSIYADKKLQSTDSWFIPD
jgi:hypothetical protein